VGALGVVMVPPAGAATDGPRVFFVEPTDGATVSSPVHVKFGVENFKVEPAGEIHPDAGHLHLAIDSECEPAGQVFPTDAKHIHYGKAQMEAELTLAPGRHTLCLQAANGAHVVLAGPGLSQSITITVK
jgi:hypothetical protein